MQSVQNPLSGGGSRRLPVGPRKASKKLAAFVAAAAAVAITLGVAVPQASAFELSDIPNAVMSFFGVGTQADESARQSTQGASLTADGDTTQKYTLGDEDSTRYDGRVWVDKSVSAGDSVNFGNNLTVANNSDFLVTYSALATSTSVHGGSPVDVVFVLDLSASMCWGTQAQTVTTEADSRIKAMVDALNESIATLANASDENRIGVAVFNGTGSVLMPLTAVKNFKSKVTDGKYFELTKFKPDGNGEADATVTCNMNDKTADTAGGTNVQAGIYQGMKLLANEDDTTYTMGDQTVTRIPNVVIMSDGAPTTFASPTDAQYREGGNDGWKDVGVITNKSSLGDGTDTQVKGSWWQPVDQNSQTGQIGGGDNYRAHSADGFMAIATASYMKNKISANYYGKDGADWGTDADNTANVYTIGFSTDQQTDAMAAMANIVLNPEDNLNDGLKNSELAHGEISNMWTAAQSYLNGESATVYGHIGNKGNKNNVHDDVAEDSYSREDMQLREFIAQHPSGADATYDVESFNYPTEYFSANDAQSLINVFGSIANLIASQAQAPTEVTGNPTTDGYITYTDTTGQYMEIKNVDALIYQNTKYTEVSSETNDGATKYTFKSDDSITNPAYPGQTYNISQIEISVTESADNHTQTIEVKIPAALIPLRVNTVELDANGAVTDNKNNGTMPLRLCYEVGLDSSIDPVTLQGRDGADGVSDDYIQANTEDGKVSFYSNYYDKKAASTANKGVGATVTFEPSPSNPFYFIQEDTPLYVDGTAGALGEGDAGKLGDLANGQIDPEKTYYFEISYYDGKNTVHQVIARSGSSLAADGYTTIDESGNLYIAKGTPRLGNLQDVTASKDGSNNTGTYVNYREPTFVYDEGSTNPQNGHFVVLLGNNGKLQVDVPGTLTIAKNVTADNGLTAPTDKAFTFELTAPSKANTADVEAVLHTDGAGDQTITLSFDKNGKAQIVNVDGTQSDITLKGGQSLEIPGMGNVQYTVVERNAANDGFKLTNVEGAAGASSADNSSPTNDVSTATAAGTVGTSNATVTFTNTYTASDATVSLNGTKNLDVADGLTHELKEGDFNFNIEALDGAPAPTSDTVSNVGSKQVEGTNDWISSIKLLDNLTFKASDMGGQTEKAFSYIVTEKLPAGVNADNPTADGITYDTAAYKVDIKVTDNEKGALSAAEPQITKGTWDGSTFAAADDQTGVNGVVFTNAYAAGTLTQTPAEITKTLNGDVPAEGAYTFSMSVVSADPQDGITLPDKHTGVANDASGKVRFGNLTFSKPGTYAVKVTEDIPAEATNADVDNGQTPYEKATAEQKAMSGWALNGTTYDSHSVQMTYRVKDAGNGALALDGDVQISGATTIANTYAATGSLTLPGFTKTLDGRDWVNGDAFTFTLTGKNVTEGVEDANAGFMLPSNASGLTVDYENAVAAAGEGKSTDGVKVPFNFDAITFSQAGTYEFTVTEGNSGAACVTNTSGSSVTYRVVVSDEKQDGQLEIGEPTIVAESGSSDFVNTYKPSAATTTLSATKTLNGVSMGISPNMFEFQIQCKSAPDDVTAPMPSNVSSDGTITNDVDGSINFGSLTFGTKGEYVYKISEVPGSQDGVKYDETVYTVVYTVTDDAEHGTLVADSTIYKGEQADQNKVDAVVFNNTTDFGDTPQKTVTDEAGENIDEDSVKIGDTLTYTITWKANADYSKVTITDAAPENTAIVIGEDGKPEATASEGDAVSYDKESGQLTWTFSDVKEGSELTVSFDVEVQKSASGTTIENTGTLTIGDNAYTVDTNTVTNPVDLAPASADATISATKTLTGRNWSEDDAFTFTIDGVNTTDNNSKNGFTIDPSDPITLTKDDADEHADSSGKTEGVEVPFSWKVTFNQAGTYTFTITEDTTGLAEKGITSKAASQQVTVVVTDVKGIQVIGEPAVADFVNTYSPKDGTSNLRATKTVNGESKNIAAGDFTFKIEAVTDNAPMPLAAPDGTVTNAAGGAIDFGTFDFAETGTYIYHVSEVNDGKAGYTYDATTYTVVFNVTDDDLTNNALDVTRTIYKGTDTTGALTNDITFVNNYHPEKVTTDASFSGTKTVTNEHGSFGALKGGEFTFVMADAQGNEVKTVKNDAAGNFSFGTLTFTDPGTYTYTVREQNTGIAGITYDGQVYTLTFKVEDKDGKLAITSQAITNAAGEKVNAGGLNFTNIYNDGQVSVDLSGTKTLDTGTFKGESLREGAFTFVLLDQDGKEIARTTNGAPNGNTATFAFSPLTYTDKDLGQHVYRVVELGADGQPGTGGTDADNITHSTQVYTVTVTVSKDADAQGSNALKAEVAIANADGQEVSGISFTNTYTPTPGVVGPSGSVQIGGTKQLSGRALNAGEFTFELLQGDQVIDTAINNADGSFTFSRDLLFDAAGTYTYAVREAAGSLGGVSYDDALYTVTITVTEDAEVHALVPTVTYQLDGKPVDAMTFNNAYTAAPAVLGNLGVAKRLENGELKDGQFTFELTAADGTPMPEETSATNAANGTVSFGPITYTEPGEYDYAITEVNDGQDGITYDANTTRAVHVSVTDNLQGSLVASVDYGENSPVFVNTVETDEPTEPSEPTEPEQPVEPGQPTEPVQPTDADQADKPQESPKADALPITGDYVPLIAAGAAVLAVAFVAGGVIVRRRQQR